MLNLIKMVKQVFIFSFIVLLFGCKKEELVKVEGNVPPYDPTIENAVYSNYINKSYILAIGEEPSAAEFDSCMLILKSNNLNNASRVAFLNRVFAHPQYKHHVFTEQKITLLNNLDTSEISNQIFVYNFILGNSTLQLFWPIANYDKQRLLVLQSAAQKYIDDSISFSKLQAIMVDNYFYDQINMGTLNFVLASFDHLLDRSPTLQEQQAGVSMCDGFTASLFLNSGYSKEDYINIVCNSIDYSEALVKKMYRKYLQRSPDTIEITDGIQLYHTTKDFEALQKMIMSTNEFVGL